ncbi:TPA: hypothetical protein EYP44_05355 [Candidatus Bathyarchaeota archaeon]|nr:hypothetical protein [Candidatus Bathyarchaeota archaeon]
MGTEVEHRAWHGRQGNPDEVIREVIEVNRALIRLFRSAVYEREAIAEKMGVLEGLQAKLERLCRGGREFGGKTRRVRR